MSTLTSHDKTYNHWQHLTPYGYTLSGYLHRAENESHRIHLLHGTGFSGLTLSEMARSLPASWSTCITDLPGHGKSEQPKHRMPDWQEMASAVYHAVANQMSITNHNRIIGIGHSLGGVLTLMAAAQHPEYFQRVILLDPPIFNRPVMAFQKILRKTHLWPHSPLVKAVVNRQSYWQSIEQMKHYLSEKALYRHWHPQALEDFCQSATITMNNGVKLACNPRWEGEIFGSYPRGLWSKIKKVGVRVDIVTAQKSYPFIKSSVDKALRLNSGINVHSFGKRHCFPMEQPDETANFIANLVNR
ncbi:alpha/beta hydrolase [Thalassotalea fusca]